LHLIVREGSKRYEIQIRTHLQQIWASIVERLISVFGIEVKYGGGEPDIQMRLLHLSDLIGRYETARRSDLPLIEEILGEMNGISGLLGGLG
jgi:ppGpp synthetase/RelA/SpoT-type nucleotidyltranferase